MKPLMVAQSEFHNGAKGYVSIEAWVTLDSKGCVFIPNLSPCIMLATYRGLGYTVVRVLSPVGVLWTLRSNLKPLKVKT